MKVHDPAFVAGIVARFPLASTDRVDENSIVPKEACRTR